MTDDELRALIERECGPVQRISDMLWAVEVAKVAMAAERERCARVCEDDPYEVGAGLALAAAIRGKELAR